MTKISAADFVKQHPKNGKTSKLEPYRDDILFLKSNGYTQQQILDFLKMNGVDAGMTTLNWFIRSRSEKNKPEPAKQRKAEPPKQVSVAASQTTINPADKPRSFKLGEIPSDEELFGENSKTEPPKQTAVAAPQTPINPADKPRKFNWQNPPTREELFGGSPADNENNVNKENNEAKQEGNSVNPDAPRSFTWKPGETDAKKLM